MELVWPAEQYLESYVAALTEGWSANTIRPEHAQEELVAIADDAEAFLASKVDREGSGPPITLSDGTTRPRLPGLNRWMWDGAFAGSINLRWQPGTAELPPHVLGHIGYSVVPWRWGRGYATRALTLLLPDAVAAGLPYVELTTETDNRASQIVIERNGGYLVERFEIGAEHDGGEALRWRIDLSGVEP
ncbi:MAG: GNAT family N-acetyltransferase [Actinomycetota bacterium]